MSSVIFMGSPGKADDGKEKIKRLFLVPAGDLGGRIVASFVPPFGSFRKVHVDLLGPSLSFLTLIAVLNYGYASRPSKVRIGPTECLFCYALFMPVISYLFVKAGRSSLHIIELVSLLGYSLYGQIFTLVLSYVCYHETSNAFFFLCLALFGGLSTLRLVLVLLKTIPFPGARVVICSFVASVQVLMSVFFHFGYMHRTFVYRQNL